MIASKHSLVRFAATIALACFALRDVSAQIVRTDHVESELVSEVAEVRAGDPFMVGLRMRMDDHWHTYWLNPGDSGLATTIEWDLPEGFRAGEIQWPTPKRIPTPPLMTYGFEGEVLLMVEITPPSTLSAGETVTIGARADWLVCEDVCIPGSGEYKLELSVAQASAGSAPSVPSNHAALFAIARARLPLPAGDEVSARFEVRGNSVHLEANLPRGVTPDAAHVYFYALDEMVIEAAQPQAVTVGDDRVVIRLARSAGTDGPLEQLRGLLVLDDRAEVAESTAGRVWQITAVPGSVGALTGETVDGATSGSLAVLLPLAFLGGLILNLMPCVFPVLGIKILGFVNQAGSERGKVTAHGLAFTAGVLASFWALAAVLAVLRAGGEELGWGFQLQSPVFVFALAVFLLVFALNLSGLFEVGLSATGVGSSLQSKSGYSGSFFTGVLATVVATPCSAPFLAPALGAAVTLPVASSFVLFTAIAAGLAAPYLVLSIFPALIKFLPRPGAWMETFKQIMAFPLYATVGFLVWVLAGQVSETGLLKVFIGLVLVAMAAWAYGRWTQNGAKGGRKVFGYVFASVAAVSGIALAAPSRPADDAVVWQTWSPETLSKLQQDGRTVYVDFTARWCATCQSNKALVFSSAEVRRRFAEDEIVALKADWTNRDAAITKALEGFGRSAVPFNLVYAPGRSEPLVLPELLTPEIVLDALDKVASRASVRRD
ncbi:thioredoxin family protein [Opitutales bacterium ASA1]|uniref:protein-disulfide reductase DsbD family protein n=1 Tax=Congregicoccus parvus TaxID=3081749 RepID=UPI002B2C25C9|nr:thioredoxin family protein [Opitutales bacterium ASA1]